MADDVDDLEYSETNIGSAQAQGVRKNISLKLKGKGRGRARRGGRGRRGPAKKVVPETPVNEEEEEEVETPEPPPDNIPTENKFSSSVSLDEVISKLEAPSFSPMDRGFPEPLHQNKKLRWDHKVNLIGEKVINPMIHCCEKCSLPILNYGRMIPCKHVFCYDCAKKADKSCPKCEDSVQRVEQSPLGTVFMCTYGGTRHVPGSCGRTYLSQRDLQAHVNHRHVKPLVTSGTSTAQVPVQTNTVQAPSVTIGATHLAVARDPRDPRAHLVVDASHSGPSVSMIGHVSHPHIPQEHRDQVDHTRNSAMQPPAMQGSPAGQPRQYPHPPASYPSAVPVSSARPNLITVPIQDDSAAATSQHVHVQSHPPQYTTPGSQAHALPPHQQHPPTAYVPPPHPYPHPHMAPVSVYSQAPSMTTQTFTQPPPPVHHPPPPIRAPNPPAPMYSTPPPPPVHHPPPTTYATPPVAQQHSSHTLPPPQRFTTSTTYEESPSYIQPWGSSGVPPPPARAPLPPRPIPAPPPQSTQSMGLLPAPSEPAYRPPYYQ